MTARFPHDFWSAPSVRAELRRADAAGAGVPASRRFVDSAAHSELAPPHLETHAYEETADADVTSSGKSISLFIPEHYEPRYAYPLVVWFHGDGGSDAELAEIMADVSTRNYIGLALRAPASDGAWPADESQLEALQHELSETVRQLRRAYNIHTERVYLAGFGSGGMTAMQLLIQQPEWFAGAAIVAGNLGGVPHLTGRLDRVRGKRVLMTVGVRDTVSAPNTVLQSARVLHAAGVDVALKVCDGGHEVTPKMLSHLNGWLMDGVCVKSEW